MVINKTLKNYFVIHFGFFCGPLKAYWDSSLFFETPRILLGVPIKFFWFFFVSLQFIADY